jgi:glycerol kinase
MRESTVLGSALLAASAVGLFGRDITRPETIERVNTARSTVSALRTTLEERSRAWRGRALARMDGDGES